MLFTLGPYELVVILGVFGVVVGGPIVCGLIVAWVRRRRETRRPPS